MGRRWWKDVICIICGVVVAQSQRKEKKDCCKEYQPKIRQYRSFSHKTKHSFRAPQKKKLRDI